MGLLDSSIPDRYEQNPMFVILENYVLDSIGKLEPDKYARLNEVISRNLGGTDWKKTIREQYDLPPDTDANLKQLWQEAIAEADAKQESLTPEDFARDVVDEMFADLGGS
jgi:hypothetical protein